MNLHEYPSNELFAQYAIPIPKGQVVGSRDSSVAAAKAFGGSLWVVKAQIHAGDRGKTSGDGLRDCETTQMRGLR